MVTKKTILFWACGLGLTVLTACGSSAPTKELRDARAAYQDASQGKAAELTPDKLLSAKQALDRAEAAHEDDPGSYQEKSLAYIAQRMSELADAYAGQADAERAAADADRQYKEAQEELRKEAMDEADRAAAALRENQERLEKVRRELADQDNKLSEAAKKLSQQEADLLQRQKELETERAARAEAERKLAAAMKSLEEIAKVKEEQRGLVITLEGAVLFASGKSTLLPIAQDKLAKVAEVLQQQPPDKRITVEGHTDSIGTESANMRLSQARADSVRDFLISHGVESSRIVAVGKGESTPIATNKTPEGRANNRRVEIVIN